MTPVEITERLQAALKKGGFRSAIVSSDHAEELRLSIDRMLQSGLIADAVYRLYPDIFNAMLKPDAEWARSIIAVAAPQPMLDAVFTVDGKKHSTIIPPTYDQTVDERVAALIGEELVSHGYRISPATLPKKLLAARSGLARYGKNNITYVEDMGSFHRLMAFYTDLPTVRDAWQEPQVLGECDGCNACTKKCPTGAIDPDRFFLHAEKCLTFHNESSQAYPEWIDESWHHCLIGCIRCQQYCPVNNDVRSWIEPFAEFSEGETATFLSGSEGSDLLPEVIAKLRMTGLYEDPMAFARNLRSVLAIRE